MSNYRFATFWTNELTYLISCIETGSYGESEYAFNATSGRDKISGVRHIKLADRVFLRFRSKLVAGPFIVSNPPEHFVIDKSIGCWHKVNIEKTPREYHPIWVYQKPWCFFFDLNLASQVNYCLFSFLPKQFSNLPPTDFIPSELGEELWKYLEDYGSSFADFLQRQGPKIRFRQFTYSQPRLHRKPTPSILNSNPIFTGRYKAKTGAIVRSKSEKLVADSLHDHGFRFEYEKTLFLGENVLHPDFFLTDCNLIVEHLGMIDQSEDYRMNWEWRRKLYDQHNVSYITLTEADIAELDKNLLTKLASRGCKPTKPG